MKDGQLAILLDRKSRAKIKTPLTELSNAGVIFLKELEDTASLNTESAATVILLGDVLENADIISKLKVYKKLLNLEYLYMGQSREADYLLRNFARVYPCDYTNINMKMITAALLRDNAYTKEFYDTMFEKERVSRYLDSPDISPELRTILEEHLSLVQRHKDLQRNFQGLEQKVKSLTRELDTALTLKKRFSTGYQKIIKSAFDLNNTLKEYEGVLTKDVYTKVDVYRYPNRPFILYFKVFEALPNQDLFFSVLYDVIQKQLHKSVKIISLYDSKSCKQIKTLSDMYHRVYGTLSTNDTLKNLIAKSGDCTELLDVLLTNKTGLDYLIIVDCKSIEDTVMLGQDLSFNVCANKKHLEAYKLSSKNTVVMDLSEDSDLVFNDVDNLIKVLDKEDTFLKLSSLPVFGQILSSIKMQRSV